MKQQEITTLGELKKSGYQSKSIQQELAQNLKERLKNGQPSFEGLIGYENTVIPDVERAILSGHNMNLLGLRGQAKTRLARQLTGLLDEWIPVVEGSEINDDPLDPISREAKELIAEKGDKTPVSWLHQSDRFYEKLATPDVTVADLIGDVDPIKASNLKLSYADERVIHFGMIPRAHRCIFVLNELPDLQARIQVALFSILQEKEIQIRGFKLRFPVQPLLIFTANPEDYTNRGSIVTPLKDRIGSQILTHYPHNREIAKQITKQEAQAAEDQSPNVHIPELARDILEQISFEARKSDYVDAKSGVSARMSITAFENLLSTANRRMLMNGDEKTSLRMADFLGIISAINGKIELVYEGEQEGAEQISYYLITQAVKTLFPSYFSEVKKLEKADEIGPYDDLLGWFFKDNELFIDDRLNDKDYRGLLDQLPGIDLILKEHQQDSNPEDRYFLIEFLLWGLEAHKKLNKYRTLEGFQFKDSLGSYISGL
ncbi:sigma 54-interacting transcriptional regulator [Flavobacteriaceae bacterium]|nr:sigma 54-interacting transcriptional regulator [Flavobacteriaceae bacterium]MDA8948966.1 sigma 54-interacting transcriptional regulator [Flavobacteriaceae bacterium]MDA9015344.1 sigma 54-interacting transcriptional regulator [Flavobacteriaceae bacterium]MDA9572397.1 sigma 54-interacting transcriptional regulator [Flavobacteriaceae bacterium]MDB3862958.1 sigma 54-interacting transcriptional regulator [Flavobacteriaceae bacterium]